MRYIIKYAYTIIQVLNIKNKSVLKLLSRSVSNQILKMILLKT